VREPLPGTPAGGGDEFDFPHLESFPAGQIAAPLDAERVRALPYSPRVALTQEEALTIAGLVRDGDAFACACWQDVVQSANDVLRQGSFAGDRGKPYVYAPRQYLANAGLAYLLTGDETVAAFLRCVVLDLMPRPLAFWLHASLRQSNYRNGVGSLETAHLGAAVALATDLAQDIFTPDEMRAIRDALREKAFGPCVKFVRTRGKSVNNWMAVVAGAVVVMGRFLDEEDEVRHAEQAIYRYLEVVEADGSYGENLGYLSYPIQSLANPVLVLGLERVRPAFLKSGLQGSLAWMTYHYLLRDPHDGVCAKGAMNPGDNDFEQMPNYLVCQMLARIFDQGLGVWLNQTYHGADASSGAIGLMMHGRFGRSALEPRSPEECDLPLFETFENGQAFIRSSWQPNGIVFCLRSGGLNRTGLAHERPDRNAIGLFAYGEYLVGFPGRASYRSPVHRDWDLQTQSHSTVCFGGRSQDTGRLAARITAQHDDAHLAFVESEAAPCYGEEPVHVRRSAVFVKQPGYFVIWDYVLGTRTDRVDWQILLNNQEGRSSLRAKGAMAYTFSMPAASLAIRVFASAPCSESVVEGYMHRSYSYNPRDPGEGERGSGILLRLSTEEDVREVSFVTVLFPVRRQEDLERFGATAAMEAPGRVALEAVCGDASASFAFSNEVSEGRATCRICVTASEGGREVYATQIEGRGEGA